MYNIKYSGYKSLIFYATVNNSFVCKNIAVIITGKYHMIGIFSIVFT
ncbi:hypothetical protein Barb7_01871 [Bacteroidales bacterium Barb7]|nr:hypothetical protein Barb7_01871 [Bacteroidales bacterium Barb7]